MIKITEIYGKLTVLRNLFLRKTTPTNPTMPANEGAVIVAAVDNFQLHNKL